MAVGCSAIRTAYFLEMAAAAHIQTSRFLYFLCTTILINLGLNKKKGKKYLLMRKYLESEA